MSYELEGTVAHIGELIHKSENFMKQDIVIKTNDEKYPQEILFEFHQNRTDVLQHISLSEKVTVHFDIRGRRWQYRWFTSLVGWKITKHDAQDPGQAKIEPLPELKSETNGDEDDLPF